MAQEDTNSPATAEKTKRLGMLMQQLLGNAGYTGLPQPMQRYILSQVTPMLDNHAIPAHSAVDMALAQVTGLVDVAKTAISEQEKQKEEGLKTNFTFDQHKTGLDALPFKQLVEMVAKDDRTFDFYKGEMDKMDEWRRRRPEWTVEQAQAAAPETLQHHLAELQAEVAVRENIVKQEQTALAHKEEVLKAMARKENISANSIEEIRKHIAELKPEHLNDNIKTLDTSSLSFLKQTQQVTKQIEQIKQIKQEITMVDKVRVDRGIEAPSQEVIDRVFSQLHQETNVSEQLIESARNDLKLAMQKQAEKEQHLKVADEKQAIVDKEMKELCDMVRDKIPGVSDNTTPREYMAAIKANPKLLQDEEVAFVYDSLKEAYPAQNGHQAPLADSKSQQTLEDISKTMQKSWTQSVTAPKADQQTGRSNNTNSWSR